MMNRRTFAASGLATLAFAGFARRAAAESRATYRNEVPGYGPLQLDGAGLLDLPPGFSYRIISRAGETMDNGFLVPDKFDGMGCFRLDRRRVALVRNHELQVGDVRRGPTAGRAALIDRLRKLPHFGEDANGIPLSGGTTTLVYDMPSGRREAQYLSLAGTAVNCAGGVTPWGSWLSCEESNLRPGDEVRQTHGWVFDVPARVRGLADPVPLKALGRFRHEAAAIDPVTGIVYLTEDRDDSLFYRFLPDRKGSLLAGGRLQALALRDAPRGDTRNWQGAGFQPQSWKQVHWFDLAGTESPEDDLRKRGHQAGAALFARGEGIHAGRGEFYFTCTSGGRAKLGQVMRYVPSPREGQPDEKSQPARLQLFVESAASTIMEYVDNITVAPWGHLIACEDKSGNSINHLKGITPGGRCYTLARLRADTELAGACFSPDGSTLFVNIYAPGKTVAITGPWGSLAMFDLKRRAAVWTS